MEVIKLNLIPGKACPVVHVSQFDDGREFKAELYEGVNVYTLDGTETLTAIVKKPDGNEVTVAVTNTSDDYVIITTTEQMTACAGGNLGTLRIEKGAVTIATLNFILECQASPDTGIQSDSEIHNLEAQVNQMVEDAVAEQYDSNNVLFDTQPTSGHGVPYAVTSGGLWSWLRDLPLRAYSTASGAIATFDTSLALPLQDCTIEINAVQESGTPTPSSPKAISGFTGANITQAPVYERVIATTPSTQTADGITVTTKANGLIEVNGTANANSTITIDCNPFVIPSIDGRTMRLNNSFLGGFTVRFFNGSTEIDYWALNAINRTVTNYSGMGGQTVNKIVIAYSSGASVTNGTLLVDFIANSTTTAITWQDEAGTVYGGSLHIVNGFVKLVATHYGKQITDTSSILDASSATVGFRARVEISSSIIPPADSQSGYDDQRSNVATYVGNVGSIGSNLGTNSFKTHTNGNIYFYLVGYNTLADLKTYAQDMITANTPITFVWKLATPVTYQLTPTQISAIVGTNNVFTDTNGNTSVVYACSLKDYIDSQ